MSVVTKMSSVRTLRTRRSSFSGLIRMPMNGGSVFGVETARHFRRACGGVSIFLRIGAIAVTVFEIEPEIFDRFAPQFFDDAGVNLLRQLLVGIHPEHVRETGRIRRIFFERPQRHRAEFLRGVGLEEMRAAIDRVHRLSAMRFSRITAREGLIRFA